jgi:hypothetical protein
MGQLAWWIAGGVAAFMGAMILLRLVRLTRGGRIWFAQSPAASLARALQETEGIISKGKRDSQYRQQ